MDVFHNSLVVLEVRCDHRGILIEVQCAEVLVSRVEMNAQRQV